MSRPEILLIIALAAIVTLAERASFFISRRGLNLPKPLERALTYVPAAVLAAIVTPSLFRPSGVAVGPIDARLIAGLVAGLVAWRTRSVLATFATGMLALWGIGWLVG